MSKIYPVILCGGMGSRLWPMSRIEQPKQFQPTNGKGSLTYFQTTVQRHRGLLFNDPIIVTNQNHAVIVNRQLRGVQSSGFVIGEPVGRNTGPAVLAAALTAIKHDPDAILLIVPSDHIIKGDLNSTVAAMCAAANDGRIITYGVRPHYPETGYGYITDGGAYDTYEGLHHVAQFVEKPPLARAQHLFESGFSYWASGISQFRADVIIGEFQRFEPETSETVRRALDQATSAPDGLTLDVTHFSAARNEPTERVVFERTSAIALAPVNIEWDDVGAWNSVYNVNERTAEGNVVSGDVITLQTRNSFIQSDDRLVTVIGMSDLIVVDTKDALLITDRKNAQMVKILVDQLKERGRPEVKSHPYEDRSWGRIDAVSGDGTYKMELLTIHPGASVNINGHGTGSSLLAVIAGEGSYAEDGAQVVLGLGHSVTIDKDRRLNLTNASTRDLQAFLLSVLEDVPVAAGELRALAKVGYV